MECSGISVPYTTAVAWSYMGKQIQEGKILIGGANKCLLSTGYLSKAGVNLL